MAQRAIHYLFGTILSEHIELKDKKRFLLGHVFPDSIEKSERHKAHFETINEMQAYYDFEEFRLKYGELMLQDDFYLGYYMHLVEDDFYRELIYRDRKGKAFSMDEVEILHKDYDLLNAYIVEKYKLENLLGKEFELNEETICEIGTFKINAFLEEMSYDFILKNKGTTVLLTEDMVDEFVEKYVPLAMKEMQAVKNGKNALKPIDYAWERE